MSRCILLVVNLTLIFNINPHDVPDFGDPSASQLAFTHALTSSASMTGLNPHLLRYVSPYGRIALMVTHRPKVKAENNLGGMCISLCPQAVCIPTGRYYSFIYLFQDSAVVPPFKTSCCDVLVNSLSPFCSVNCWKAFMHLKQQAFLATWELITNAS